MTCFWDSILASMTTDDFILLGVNNRLSRVQFIQTLKNKNKITNVLWEGTPLREQEKKEHFEAIKDYNIGQIHNGHLTSICDSFLLLLCDLLQVNIEHQYLCKVIKYSNPQKVRKTLRFRSNRGHFSKL